MERQHRMKADDKFRNSYISRKKRSLFAKERAFTALAENAKPDRDTDETLELFQKFLAEKRFLEAILNERSPATCGIWQWALAVDEIEFLWGRINHLLNRAQSINEMEPSRVSEKQEE